ncbi:hypothetical protein F3Y22_tig00004355pilonHSYRG00100 [Hibiscus syriacus]|uniref:MULE transposase domain-containing protein n=1 Tax=Hibiscus syriacus TaxID=106335 RepID=A0A6A3CN29_HIBSY|nr:hypothetical protein F3Y22_tig00004355pilonHSYRG00100 [Hibiscus syriacus]
MDNTDVDNVKPTEECHEVHNVDESDRLVGQLFCSRDQAWYFYKGFAREHGFSARKGTTRLDVEGNVKTQEFCCSKEGFRVSKVILLIVNVLIRQSQEQDVLQNFLEAMMNKSPISVVTDGDRAMQRAIKSVIPYAKHRLCSWHLSRNAQANIEFNVQKHPWVIEKGNTRHLWAQAYLTGHFFANIRSTQRCESMNASLAIALKHKKTYLDVVRAIEDGISRMRMNELKADYLSSHTKPFQITKLVDLESHAAAIFTRESFRTNDAKASAPNYVDLNVSPEVMQMARFAALRSTSSRLCYIASKTDESFKTARDEMKN